ncbi:MAG TPA: tetratricopeptide repeat-containing protein kinase family protein, partial [Kofleriaceae bacterium]|nr:tetratricopeptide repeat-containing protein kinase family protein [Kofleriaceae bacterium]
DSEPGPSSDVLQVSLTLTGARVGTPRYMAPEQRTGGPITPKADQYSFCVALWEALHGERPPGAERADVPGFLDSALERGLAQDPEQRWPAMDALLAALSHDPARRRRQIAVATAVVALSGVVAWSALRARANPCLGASARLAGVWDTPRKDAVRRAFLATGTPYAEATWQRVSARLDAYAAGWADMHGEACRATRVEGRQSDTLMDLRMSCLESDRALLGALSGLWAGGMDKETLNAASDAVGGLPPVAECADTRALTERVGPPADRAQAARIATARAHLDEVQAMILAHRWADARKQVTAVRAEADATGWSQVRAEAAFAEADVLHDLSDPSAEVPFLEAHRLAALAHDDRLAARALIEFVKSLAVDDQHADRALVVADVAAGAVARAGDAPGLRGQLLAHRAEALFTKNNFDAAHEAFASAQTYLTEALGPDDSLTLWNEAELARTMDAQGQALEARRLLEANLEHTIRVLGAEHPTVASKLNNLGLIAWELGDYEGAAAQFRRALAIKERVGGADAAWSARTLSNLAGVEGDLNHLDVASDLEEHALTIRERMFGTEHAQVALSLTHLASFRRKEGHYAQALELLHRALAIDTKTLGPNHRAVVDTLADIADVLDTEGDRAGALDDYRRALDVLRKSAGPDHPSALHLTNRVADELALLHRCDEARALLATSTTSLEKTLGPDNPYVGEALAATAECDLAAGHAAQAVANLERAIAIEEKSHGPPVDRGSYRWRLARALWSLGRHDEARAAAQKAEQELDGDADGARDRAAADAWLASHRQ